MEQNQNQPSTTSQTPNNNQTTLPVSPVSAPVAPQAKVEHKPSTPSPMPPQPQKPAPGGKKGSGMSWSTQQKVWVSAVALVVLVGVAALVSGEKKEAVDETQEVAEAIIESQNASDAPRVLSYQEAVARYQGVTISFDESCKATPNTLSVKKGTTIMFDNRFGVQRGITIGEKSYAVGGYKYRTVVLDAVGAFPVHCDAVKDAAALIVEA